jgi:hypothetical protein
LGRAQETMSDRALQDFIRFLFDSEPVRQSIGGARPG